MTPAKVYLDVPVVSQVSISLEVCPFGMNIQMLDPVVRNWRCIYKPLMDFYLFYLRYLDLFTVGLIVFKLYRY